MMYISIPGCQFFCCLEVGDNLKLLTKLNALLISPDRRPSILSCSWFENFEIQMLVLICCFAINA
jgi:hypothetical protein